MLIPNSGIDGYCPGFIINKVRMMFTAVSNDDNTFGL